VNDAEWRMRLVPRENAGPFVSKHTQAFYQKIDRPFDNIRSRSATLKSYSPLGSTSVLGMTWGFGVASIAAALTT
jgi:hypothetical protein